MKDLPLAKVYQLLEPGPVVCRHGEWRPRQRDDHVLAHDGRLRASARRCIVSTGDYSFAALRKTKECVIAIPSVNIADLVVKIGNCPAATSTSSPSSQSRRKGPSRSGRRSFLSASPISNAAWSRRVSSISTTSSFSRWSRRGSSLSRRTQRRSITAATAHSSSMARSSSSSRACDRQCKFAERGQAC